MSFADSYGKLPKNRETQFPISNTGGELGVLEKDMLLQEWRLRLYVHMLLTDIRVTKHEQQSGSKKCIYETQPRDHLQNKRLSPPKGIPTSVQNLPQQMGCSSPAPQKARNAPAMNLVQPLGTSF